MTTKKRTESGFTLIEILVALALTGIVLTAIYTAYQSQQKTYITQESVAKMQQNLRAAMFLMAREIRMAGFDPRGTAGAGINSASSQTSINFTEDIRGSAVGSASDGDTGDPNENITYTLNAGSLQKNGSTVAQNISGLSFQYLAADGTTPVAAQNARFVEITLVAQTDRSDPDYTNTILYPNQLGNISFGPYNDGFHRRVLSTRIECRNLGLN